MVKLLAVFTVLSLGVAPVAAETSPTCATRVEASTPNPLPEVKKAWLRCAVSDILSGGPSLRAGRSMAAPPRP